MSQLQVHVAVAKIAKYAAGESGDSLEMIERPHGGLSLVLVDGQRSGKAAKSISNMVVRKAVSLLGDGVRDGAVARAAHDYLRTMRGGQVSATLNIVSIDMQTETIVLSRNSHCPVLVSTQEKTWMWDEPSEPVGIHTWTKPVVVELPLQPRCCIVAFTDGLLHAGARYGRSVDILAQVQAWLTQSDALPHTLADSLLNTAITYDQGRPADDISVLIVYVRPAGLNQEQVRRMQVEFPIRIKDIPPQTVNYG